MSMNKYFKQIEQQPPEEMPQTIEQVWQLLKGELNLWSVKRVSKNNWLQISLRRYLTEEFVDKYHDKLNWYYLSVYQKMSDEFILKYAHLIRFDMLEQYNKQTKLSDELKIILKMKGFI